MILIKSDENRRIAIPGVPAPVQRPVDIDQAKTGFTNLRTLRIYRFEIDSVIEGHAEEDEVFIVLLSGAAELTMFEDVSNLDTSPTQVFTLSAADAERGVACAAYLPPRAGYKLVAKTDADVAYARATPSAARPLKVFSSSATATPGVSILLEVTDYAERLRLRLLHVDARKADAVLMTINAPEAICETLVHVRTVPTAGVATISKPGAGPILLDSWDTVSVDPGDRPSLRMAMGSSALLLLVLAV